MISLSVRSDADAAIRALNQRRSQIPFATSLAINRTAFAVRDAEYREMVDVFDRPTPYTLNSLAVQTSTKQDLKATVYLKYAFDKGTPADKYLSPEIKGGQRPLKRFERALRAARAWPDGYEFAVPGAAAEMDAYGNMKPSQIVQILSYFRAFPEQGYRANRTPQQIAKLARGTKRRLGYVYFVGAPAGGKLPMGIWQRFAFAHGSAIKPILIFVKSAHYPVRLDFDYVAQKTVEKVFPGGFQKALSEAQGSAL